jgi:hypothetical protein
VWEKKDNLGGVHDVGNTYQWSSSGTAADGSLFTTFLTTLNTVPCFAGHCDWRIPNIKELQSIVDYSKSFREPSIVYTFPGFIVVFIYWSSISLVGGNPDVAWGVGFDSGGVYIVDGSTSSHARAVRGGS